MYKLKLIKKVIREFGEQKCEVPEYYLGGVVLDMLWCVLRYGARPIDYVRFEFYKKNHRERNRYLTILRYFKHLRRFGCYNHSTHGKVAEYNTFAKYIRRPWMVANKETEVGSLRTFINERGLVFAKPNSGEQGNGVLKIKAEDEKAVVNLIEAIKKQPYVVEGAIVNTPEIARLNPSSVNTVRVVTLTDKQGKPSIFSVVLRVGAPGSIVDNWGSGGVGYHFNLETGICDQYGKDKKNRKYIFHPGSKVQMIGYKLPHFEELKDYVLKLAALVPEDIYIGWDVAITPDGFDLVEMNCPAGHDLSQAFDNPIYDTMKKIL